MRSSRSSPLRRAASAVSAGALGLIIGGCSSASSTAPTGPPAAAAATDQTAVLGLAPPYRSPDGYRISVPEGWIHYPIPASHGASISFTSMALDRNAAKPFADTVNVKVAPTDQPLAVVVAEHSVNSRRWGPRLRVVSERSTVLPNRLPAHLLEVEFELSNLGLLRGFELVTVSAGRSYLVTLIAAPATFDRLRIPFEKCVTSLIPDDRRTPPNPAQLGAQSAVGPR